MVSSSAKRACHGRDPPDPGLDIMGLPCPPRSRPWDCRALPFPFFLRVLLLADQSVAQMRPSISICGVQDLVHRCG